MQIVCPIKQVFKYCSLSGESESIQWRSMEYVTNFSLEKNKGMGRQLQRIYCKYWKLLLGQLSAYQCLILVYLYKTEVTNTSHEYLTHSSASSAKPLHSPQMFVKLWLRNKFNNRNSFNNNFFKLLEESSGLVMKEMSLFHLVFGPAFIIRKLNN